MSKSSLCGRIVRLEAGALRAPEPLPPPFWSDECGCHMQAHFGGALVVPAPMPPEEWEPLVKAQQDALTRSKI